jgi:Ca2+-binding RTX toxin-like protein
MLGTLSFASSASASTHEVMIREVFLGAAGNDAFVELQMFSAGQNQVTGQKVNIYQADGSLLAASPVFPSSVPNGQNQRTILIADTAVPGGDLEYPMMTAATLGYGPGGAACFTGSGDCVAWGNFVDTDIGFTGNPGTPVLPGGIPAGASITRKLTRGCRTLLDPADDTNNSAADFAQTNNPSPRGNAAAPTEKRCAPCGGKLATITGTAKKNKLRGTAGKDIIAGLGGNDTIRGLGGNDILCGGGGRDRLIGGGGKDRLLGGPGKDTLLGGGGRDKLVGGPGRDTQVQ